MRKKKVNEIWEIRTIRSQPGGGLGSSLKDVGRGQKTMKQNNAKRVKHEGEVQRTHFCYNIGGMREK